MCPMCGLTTANIRDDEFSCRGGLTNQIVYRAMIIGTTTSSPTDLVSLIQSWVMGGAAYIRVPSATRLYIDQDCNTPLDTLWDPDCPLSTTSTPPPAISTTTRPISTSEPDTTVPSTTAESSETERSVEEGGAEPAIRAGMIGGIVLAVVIVALVVVFLVVLIVTIVKWKAALSDKRWEDSTLS